MKETFEQRKTRLRQVAERVRRGDRAAEEELVRLADFLFSRKLARRCNKTNGLYEDALQECRISTITTVREWDGSGDILATLHSRLWKASSMVASQANTIRIPYKTFAQLSADLRAGRKPAGTAAQAQMARCITASATVGDEDGDDILSRIRDNDTPSPADESVASIIRKEGRNLLKTLPKKERTIIEAIYGIGMPAFDRTTVGMLFGISRQAVGQIEGRTIRKLQRLASEGTTCKSRRTSG